MKIDEKHKEWQPWYNKGLRFKPDEKIIFIQKGNHIYIPDKMKDWQIQEYEPSEYLQQRLAPIQELTQKMQLIDPNIIDGQSETLCDMFGYRHEVELYKNNEHGDIEMVQFNLDRRMFYSCKYNSPEDIERAGQAKIYQVKKGVRLNPLYQEILMPDSKYDFTNFHAVPFFDPALIKMFEDKQKTETIIATEGQFKTFVANRIGLAVIGLTGITHWRDQLSKGLHIDMLRFIERTAPVRFVLLWDGDCLNISKKPNKPQSLRPYLFFRMAYTILTHIKAVFPKIEIYFARIKTEKMLLKPKGLDDLILSYSTQKHIQRIKNDLEWGNTKSPYCEIINVTNDTKKALEKFFALDKYRDSLIETIAYLKNNIIQNSNTL